MTKEMKNKICATCNNRVQKTFCKILTYKTYNEVKEEWKENNMEVPKDFGCNKWEKMK